MYRTRQRHPCVENHGGVKMRHYRYYDPARAQFRSADTIVPGAGALTHAPHDPTARAAWGISGGPGNVAALNRYAYTENNPSRTTGPTRHCGSQLATPTPGSASTACGSGSTSGGGSGGGTQPVTPVQPPNTSSGVVTFMIGDHLGSVRATTNAQGQRGSVQYFDPWGKVRSGIIDATNYGYTGQRRENTGLMYYNARY